MPVIDGIEFVQRLRAVAVAPAYVIMSTGSADAKDYERGYCAGVDLYISKKGDDAALVVKVNTGLAAIRKRQGTSSGHPAGAALLTDAEKSELSKEVASKGDAKEPAIIEVAAQAIQAA